MRNYYAGYSPLGIEKDISGFYWSVFAFPDMKSRDRWVSKNEYDGTKVVCRRISKHELLLILGRETGRKPWVSKETGLPVAEYSINGTEII